MQPDVPFVRCHAVDMDVCSQGIQFAMLKWFEKYESYPSVVWVPMADLLNAERAIMAAPEGSFIRRLAPVVDPTYQIDWWSVGTYTNKGFGSVGA
jgi:hypothetical protein